ncbi:hypothetical protein Daura_44260 [Dactylosporangium aurantiacum]|uniref:CBM6 domain-containing protein n=1 Tax=Dactylosporangium aurantiacum TaxID=35754 RepID=A0A9Q9MC01_9ACTN|nr:hypothetical protein [Dactylosporangium aurantiacum]MDG6102203.1 hypothetical protein [Dactylosporangium aurantiacum]UWZ53483.1 hypothetical protein Daura_44260 [Dactylosporangium aurantiacum]
MDRPPVTGDATVHAEGRVWPRRLGWAALAAAVAATATFVPPLVLPDGRDHPPAATAPTPPRTSPPATEPAATPSPAAGGTTPAVVPRTPSAKPSASAGFAPISLHAADEANLRNGARIIECPTCVGGSRVGYIGGPNTLAIRVADVPAAGERTLTVTYETAETRTLRVSVGDGPVHTLTLSGAGDWRIPASVSLRVHLPAGTSWVRFFNDAGPAPDVNRIELR